MSKFLIALLLCVSALGQTSVAPNTTVATNTTLAYSSVISFVSSNSTGAAMNTTGATLLVVGCGAGTGSTGASSSPSNTWTATGATLNSDLNIYYAYAPTTSTSQTFACVGGSSSVLGALALKGTLTTSGVFDNRVLYGNGNSTFTLTATPAIAGEVGVVIAWNTDVSCDYVSLGGSPTWNTVTSNTTACWLMGYAINAAAGTFTANVDFGSDANLAVAMIALFEP